MKKYLSKIIIAIIVLGLIGGWFYWFQWRPSEIRKNCAEDVKSLDHNVLNDKYGKVKKSDYYNDMYRNCLHINGL